MYKHCEICDIEIPNDFEEYCDRCGAVICPKCCHSPQKHVIKSIFNTFVTKSYNYH